MIFGYVMIFRQLEGNMSQLLRESHKRQKRDSEKRDG